MQSAIRNPQSAIALLAAAVVLLAAWVLPLPRLVLSEEEDAATRMPQTRADVASARAAFEQAQLRYKGYVATHDIGAAIDDLERATAEAQEEPANEDLLNAARTAARPVLTYVSELELYASAGQDYFYQLRYFDEELMAWTRSLGAGSEVLRADTWPIVEYLKLYPAPPGVNDDYANVTPNDVAEIHAGLSRGLSSTRESPQVDDPLRHFAFVIPQVRTAGRSVEYKESLHTGYETLLQDYHTRLQAVASGTRAGGLSGSRALFAYAVDALLGLLLLAGMAALFLSRRTVERELAS
jgi:hypothetical protein